MSEQKVEDFFNVEPLPRRENRVITICGEIDENKGEVVLEKLLQLHQDRFSASYSKPESTEDNENKDKEEEDVNVEIISQPIEMLICTNGGDANEMFAMYDVMRMVMVDCDISTFGVGKVMSAGVLLLAAGTKGKRKIGKNCRVMIHQVQAGAVGSGDEMKNEVDEILKTQDRYVEALSAETAMSKKEIKKFLGKKVNVYLSAEEAVQFGIADIVV